MYVYQNDKLYVQLEDGLVGVEIHSNETVLLKGENPPLSKRFEILTPAEVEARFQGEFKFPKKEVKNDDPVSKAKAPVGRPARK